MINELYRAKDIVNKVYDKTGISECGDVLCSIDEAIGAIEDES